VFSGLETLRNFFIDAPPPRTTPSSHNPFLPAHLASVLITNAWRDSKARLKTNDAILELPRARPSILTFWVFGENCLKRQGRGMVYLPR